MSEENKQSNNSQRNNIGTHIMVSILSIGIGSVLFAYVAFASTIGTQQTSIQQMIFVFRHGDRNPTETYPNDPYRNYKWQGGWGALTKDGMLRMYNIGQWIRTEYGSIIGNTYDSTLSLTQSSYADRCIMSAQVLLASLYPPTNEEIFVSGLTWRPVPVHSTPRHLDKIIVVKAPCPRLEKALKEAYVNDSKRPEFPSSKYFQELSNYTGQNISTITDIEFLYNTLEIEERNGLKLPEWTIKYYNQQMREIAARSLALFTSNTLQQRLRGGPLLKEILPTSGLLPNLEKPDSSETLNSSSRLSDGLKNPGTIEDLHKKCKDVFPANFEGAKLMFNKGLSNHFQISHTISMSSIAQSGYRFGATYVGTQQPVPSEAYPVLLGDIDPSGNLNANIIHQFGERLRGKLATQVQKSKFTAVQMTTDYRGDAYTVSLTLGNPDILNGSGVFVMHYLQSITPSVALGGELAYQRGPAVPGGQVAVLSAAGRYTNGDSTISGSLGLSGCHLCFHQKASQQLQVGVELEINCRIQESTGAIAYQIDLPKADLIFRGSVDTNWTVGAVLEKKLQPLPFTFALSGMINHSKPQFRLGCGLIIG